MTLKDWYWNKTEKRKIQVTRQNLTGYKGSQELKITSLFSSLFLPPSTPIPLTFPLSLLSPSFSSASFLVFYCEGFLSTWYIMAIKWNYIEDWWRWRQEEEGEIEEEEEEEEKENRESWEGDGRRLEMRGKRNYNNNNNNNKRKKAKEGIEAAEMGDWKSETSAVGRK